MRLPPATPFTFAVCQRCTALLQPPVPACENLTRMPSNSSPPWPSSLPPPTRASAADAIRSRRSCASTGSASPEMKSGSCRRLGGAVAHKAQGLQAQQFALGCNDRPPGMQALAGWHEAAPAASNSPAAWRRSTAAACAPPSSPEPPAPSSSGPPPAAASVSRPWAATRRGAGTASGAGGGELEGGREQG